MNSRGRLGHRSPSRDNPCAADANLRYDTRMPAFDDAFINQSFEATSPPRRRLGFYFLIGVILALLFVPAISGRGFGLSPSMRVAIPVVISLATFSYVGSMTRRQRARRKHVVAAWDSVQLEEWDTAEARVRESLSRPLPSSADRCQAFLALAAILERRRQFETAMHVYERLLIERIGDPYQLQHAQIAMTAAKFRNEELTDGIQMLDRLEKFPMPLSLKAAVAWIRLYQQVFMGQFEDAVKNLEEIRPLFRRYLSTRAGYAYALVSKALHQLGRFDQAGHYWRDATLLVRSPRLIEEYPFLQPSPAEYPASEIPV